MAVIKAVSSRAGITQALDYVMKEEKTEKRLVSGLGCMPESAKDEMQLTKELWEKTGGRTYKHFVQSYHEDEKITPEQAHRNAIELAENTRAWRGFEVLIATHVDRGHIHSHFIVNSVSYEDGHKLRWSKHDLKDLKERNDEQCLEQGLHVTEKGKTFSGDAREDIVAYKKDTYQLLKQAEKGEVKSYVQEIAMAVLDCKERATCREDFINQMQEMGYGVDWQENHKYITFTDLQRADQGERQCKIRNNKLEKYYGMDFGKEELEHEFEINVRRAKETESQHRSVSPGEPNAFRDHLNAEERASAEKRDHSETERGNSIKKRDHSETERGNSIKKRDHSETERGNSIKKRDHSEAERRNSIKKRGNSEAQREDRDTERERLRAEESRRIESIFGRNLTKGRSR
jgi:hypothetical protein